MKIYNKLFSTKENIEYLNFYFIFFSHSNNNIKTPIYNNLKPKKKLLIKAILTKINML